MGAAPVMPNLHCWRPGASFTFFRTFSSATMNRQEKALLPACWVSPAWARPYLAILSPSSINEPMAAAAISKIFSGIPGAQRNTASNMNQSTSGS